MTTFGKIVFAILAILITVAVCIMASGCTDAEVASITAIGSPAEVTCYSGGQVVYQGQSTGRVASLHESDGWQFMEQGTNQFVRVSGTCIVRN